MESENITSIETAIKHFERKRDLYGGKINSSEILKVLHAMKQFDEENLTMVGVGYVRYDGIEFKKTPLSDMYEGGFAVVRKQKNRPVSQQDGSCLK